MRRFVAATFAAAALAAGIARAEPPVPSPPVIAIEMQQYLGSGTFTTFRATDTVVLWVQQVFSGDLIKVVNIEPTFPTYQHTVTECDSPCRALPPNGTPTWTDGGFDTGIIAYAGGQATIDTADLDLGLHEYSCTLHPWMRGAFLVADLY